MQIVRKGTFGLSFRRQLNSWTGRTLRIIRIGYYEITLDL